MPRRVAALAARQYGVVSRTQLIERGVSERSIDRQLQSGRLHRLHSGVYAVGHAVLVPNGRRLAAVLACGPGAALSHGDAAAVHRLRRAGARTHVTVPRGGSHSRGGIVVHRVRRVAPEDVTEVNGIRVTTVARTALDLAETPPTHALVGLLERMEILRVFDLTELRATMGRNPGRRGLKPLSEALARLDDAPEADNAALQRRFLRLCRRLGLPEPRQQVIIGPYTVDFFWPAAGLVVETDGGRHHATRAAFERDRRRDVDLAARGLRVLRLTWHQVNKPEPALPTALSQLATFGTI